MFDLSLIGGSSATGSSATGMQVASSWVNAKQVRFSDLVNCHLAK